jgi:hypothetical protein
VNQSWSTLYVHLAYQRDRWREARIDAQHLESAVILLTCDHLLDQWLALESGRAGGTL